MAAEASAPPLFWSVMIWHSVRVQALLERFHETDQLPANAGLLHLRLAMTAVARHCEARSAEAIQTFVHGAI
jgi:hypothetical protein